MAPNFVYEAIELDEIELIRPLWDELRLFTRDMSTHFTRYYEDLDWNERIEKFSDPAVQTRIDVAREGEGGRVVGYALASVSSERVAELGSFYVDAGFRHRGIGERLLEGVVEWMVDQDPKECVILTAYENEAVLPLYERFGFFPRLVMLNRK